MASLFATTFVSRGNLCWPPRPRKGFLYAHPASSENSLILRRDASRGRPRDGVRAADRADRPRPVTARRSDSPAWALGQRKRRRGGRSRSLPRHGEPFRLGGGPLTSMASLFATTSASGQNLSGRRRPRKRRSHVHFAFSGKTRYAPRRRALANEKTRREPLEEPSAPVQAPSRTGRRASHLDGLALCVS